MLKWIINWSESSSDPPSDQAVMDDPCSGLWLVNGGTILASDWSRRVTWPEHWPLIGCIEPGIYCVTLSCYINFPNSNLLISTESDVWYMLEVQWLFLWITQLLLKLLLNWCWKKAYTNWRKVKIIPYTIFDLWSRFEITLITIIMPP